MTKRPPPAAIVPVVATSALSTALAPAAAAATAYAGNARAANTRRAYKTAWRLFATWCAGKRAVALPADPATVAMYLAALAAGQVPRANPRRATDAHRPRSLVVYLAAIRAQHLGAGHSSPCEHPAVLGVLEGIRRTHGTRAVKKDAATVDVLRVLVAALDPGESPYVRDRNRALVTVGFGGALRRSELVALDWGDVAWRRDGLLVTVARSKTDQRGAGESVHVHAARDPGDARCPRAALETWRSTLGRAGGVTEGKAPVFVALSRNAWLERLSPDRVAHVVKTLAGRAGLDPARYAGHSLRRGFATSAAGNGRSLDRIRAHTRHKSLDMLREYLADELPWDDDAGAGLL